MFWYFKKQISEKKIHVTTAEGTLCILTSLSSLPSASPSSHSSMETESFLYVPDTNKRYHHLHHLPTRALGNQSSQSIKYQRTQEENKFDNTYTLHQTFQNAESRPGLWIINPSFLTKMTLKEKHSRTKMLNGILSNVHWNM